MLQNKDWQHLLKKTENNEEIESSIIVKFIENLTQKLEMKLITFSDKFLNTINCNFSDCDSNIQTQFDALMNLDMPSLMMKEFRLKLLLEDGQDFVILIEYLKFLVLKSKDEDIVPSFFIDQLWKEHFTNTKHYRDL
jgi:hypothetical protein